MKVTLSWLEVVRAAEVGIRRRVGAMQANRPEPYGKPAFDLWGSDIVSSAAELAAAKALCVYWPGAIQPDHAEGDLGNGLGVRYTPREDGCLIIHPRDSDLATHVLVTGAIPTFNVVGSIWGALAKKEQWWRTDTGRPAYFVPQSALEPIPERRKAAA